MAVLYSGDGRIVHAFSVRLLKAITMNKFSNIISKILSSKIL
jgi:hypothetical protein